MDNSRGVVIKESLENSEVLKKIKILSTRIEPVTKKHQTPWLSQWTLVDVEISEIEAASIAREISESIISDHEGSWYADFKNDSHHYIIFRNRIFCVDRTSKGQYDEAKNYGMSLGIPEYQADFHPAIEEWDR